MAGYGKRSLKDQTDFLAQIDYLQISKLMFPIGGLTKQEVREIADAAGLPSAKRKDSQGICFLGKINYNDFVRRFLGRAGRGDCRTGNRKESGYTSRLLVPHYRATERGLV